MNSTAKFSDRSSKALTIGLINNMPDNALEATERQFVSVLDSASDGIPIHLSFYSLPGIARNVSGSDRVSKFYSSAEELWGTHLDGLIVTGREPMAADLADEPYWESFTSVLDWARANTYSAVWSCLAAHAAVQYMDGIRRIRSPHKYCGIFECTRVSEHAITDGVPSDFRLPHSRWNGLSEGELADCGYTVLTRAAEVGVDSFCKLQKSLFVFFQGHPEYESATLLLEYRRDVGRYLRRETDTYPSMPKGYFNGDAVQTLQALQEEAMTHRNQDLLERVAGIFEKITIENTWRPTAVCLYRNWLRYISGQKALGLRGGKKSAKAPKVDDLLPSLLEASGESSAAVLA
jgi:homoserine O-succinyltransferase